MSESLDVSKRLALFDLDGTLINESYQVTDDGIYQAIQQAQDVGWRVGLSSDTPYEPLAAWRDKFGMNGPIIAENGAVVELTSGELLFDAQDDCEFTESRKKLTAELPALGVPVWSGNSTEAVHTKMQFGEPGQTVVLVNNFCRASLRFFVRNVSSTGELTVNAGATTHIAALCEQFELSGNESNPPESLRRTVDIETGLVISALSKNIKRIGTQKLLAALGNSSCVMVGNSMGDYLGSDICTQYAVSNANDDYKKLINDSCVTPGAYTLGCSQILKTLAVA
jgi:hypothetical protein